MEAGECCSAAHARAAAFAAAGQASPLQLHLSRGRRSCLAGYYDGGDMAALLGWTVREGVLLSGVFGRTSRPCARLAMACACRCKRVLHMPDRLLLLFTGTLSGVHDHLCCTALCHTTRRLQLPSLSAAQTHTLRVQGCTAPCATP